ncbi:MAG TPA: class I SAM-dependent methyltransferase [Methylomirabilota bacterium]
MIRTGILGGALADRVLSRFGDPASRGYCDGSAYRGLSKLEVLFGPGIWADVTGKDVLDFGCGSGEQVVEIARRGARHVSGLDILETALASARDLAQSVGVADRCSFGRDPDRKADVVISVDGFEHFADPRAVLEMMHRILRPGGRVLIAFGPTWLHPLGGHLFSVFPWAHLVFTEAALIRWRARFKHDGARRFSEVEGGLNQMTIRWFKRLVAESAFTIEAFEPVPIRRLRALACPLTRELFTSFVRCRLVPKGGRA